MIATHSSAIAPAEELAYWRYLRLDTLLNLQHPRTDSPDEKPFIILHQIAELLFSTIIHELEQITDGDDDSVTHWKHHLTRVVAYFKLLLNQLCATGRGVDKQQFQLFRNALGSASGFQSFQYRKIELLSARLYDLTHHDSRPRLTRDSPAEALLENLYWRRTASVSGKGKSEALADFENRYMPEVRRLADRYENDNLAARFTSLAPTARRDPGLTALLKQYDNLANVAWPQTHMRLALSFLMRGDTEIRSTGDTNWTIYLTAKQQNITYFPELVSS